MPSSFTSTITKDQVQHKQGIFRSLFLSQSLKQRDDTAATRHRVAVLTHMPQGQDDGIEGALGYQPAHA